MSASEPGTDPTASAAARRRLRKLAVPVVLVAVVVPYAVALVTLWSRTGDDLTTTRREQAGITALRPLVALLAATVDTQSAAVAGRAVDQAPLRKAVAAMDEADAAVGVGLGTGRRWVDLRTRLTHLSTAAESRGASAYTAFSQLIDLELALLSAVSDASRLPLDPAIDSHYLAAATTEEIPALIVSAGQISDLTLLLEQRRAPAPPDTLPLAVAQAEFRDAADRLDDGLRKGFEGPTGQSLGPTPLRELDRLQDAATDVAPPLSAVGAAPTLRPASVTGRAARQLRDAAVTASGAALDRLAGLVDARAEAISTTRRITAVTTGAGLAVVLVIAWFVAPRRRTEAAPAPDMSGVPAGRTLPRVGARLPESSLPAEAGSEDLIEARELLDGRQLLRVGRAVSAVREEDPPPAEEDL
jgi:hypothetical protein